MQFRNFIGFAYPKCYCKMLDTGYIIFNICLALRLSMDVNLLASNLLRKYFMQEGLISIASNQIKRAYIIITFKAESLISFFNKMTIIV